MPRVLLATSNAGKRRDFSGAAAKFGVEIALLPGFASLPGVVEDGATFEDNARKKARHYSRCAPGELIVADDSGLEVEALAGAPGVHSARFATEAGSGTANFTDTANNARLLAELNGVPDKRRGARFVCILAAACDGGILSTFRGEASGRILHQPRGSGGFGYDPLFFFPELGKTFAELTAVEKAAVSHRGQAFRQFLEWYAGRSER